MNLNEDRSLHGALDSALASHPDVIMVSFFFEFGVGGQSLPSQNTNSYYVLSYLEESAAAANLVDSPDGTGTGAGAGAGAGAAGIDEEDTVRLFSILEEALPEGTVLSSDVVNLFVMVGWWTNSHLFGGSQGLQGLLNFGYDREFFVDNQVYILAQDHHVARRMCVVVPSSSGTEFQEVHTTGISYPEMFPHFMEEWMSLGCDWRPFASEETEDDYDEGGSLEHQDEDTELGEHQVDTVEIGYISQSSPKARYQLHGFLLAVNDLNFNGGLLGHRVIPRVIFADSPSSAEAGINQLDATYELPALFAAFDEVTRRFVSSTLQHLESGVLFVSSFSQGQECYRDIVYGGGVPDQYVETTIDWALHHQYQEFVVLDTSSANSGTNSFAESALGYLQARHASVQPTV